MNVLFRRLTASVRLLSRAHSNYLAQINIRMNERQEQTADVLGKLTVLGTIVLPMNIITGMWGMNVKVPGQDIDNPYWFWSSKSFSISFLSYLLTKRNFSYGWLAPFRHLVLLHRQTCVRYCIDWGARDCMEKLGSAWVCW